LNKKRRNKNGTFKYAAATVFSMAITDNVTGEPADLFDSLSSDSAAKQVGRPLALLPLVTVIDTLSDTVGTTEPTEYI
jgi:hypothetical protein